MSQVTARKRGSFWEYRFEGISVEGKRKQYSKSGFKTKKEALQAGTAMLVKYNRTGILFESRDMSIADFANYWYENYALKNLRANTLRSYQSIMVNIIKPELGSYNLSTSKRSIFIEFFNRLSSNYTKATLKTIKTILHEMYDYAINLEWIEYNPLDKIRLPENTKKKSEKDVIHKDDFTKIFEAVSESYKFIFLLVWNTGLRITEACSLSWDDIDFENQRIFVRKQIINHMISPLKTQNSERTIPFGESLKAVLLAEKNKQDESRKFYGRYYTYYSIDKTKKVVISKENRLDIVARRENGLRIVPSSIQCLVSKLNNKLGINFSFHSLRHGHTTMLVENNAPIKAVQARLGHSSPQITMNIYAHVTKSQEDQIVEILEQIAHEK